MMSEDHPDEIELLAHSEGEIRSNRAREVAAHVAACPRCAEAVAEARAGRTALRAAPRLELGATFRAAISAALAAQPAPRRRPFASRARIAAVLVPAAVASALTLAVVEVRDRDGGDDAGRETRAASAGATGPRGGEGAATRGPRLEALTTGGQRDGRPLAATRGIARVAGPATEIVAVLRGRGLTARISGGRVVVSQATRQQVLEALRGRARGRVRVVAE